MIDIMRTRRSVRSYEKKPLDERSLQTMKEALLRCPSSMGKNPWTFIFVDNPETLLLLSKTKEHGSDFLKGAALGIVVCGDEAVSDVWVEDCAIASVVVQLTAHSLGLGSCWVQIRKRNHSSDETAEEYVQKALGIPKNVKVDAIISIGHPAEVKAPRSAEQLEYRKIHYNRYGERQEG
ncbi:MAG: nitroreductase family protein [Syntrophorhabdales bacterium]|jgi:nitroreductase